MKRRKITILFILFGISIQLFSQTFYVGKKDVTYYDPDRFYRSVGTKIYYPATSSGNNAPIASGQFPLVVFGHGFLMPDENLYSYLWNAIVSQGYIVAFPTTEGSIIPPPNHLEFAKDLIFLYNKLMSENNTATSFFYNKLQSKAAVMGHSMGGKAATMAAANNTPFKAYISLAAAKEEGANNNNLLGNYAPYVTLPSLVISGLKDCAAPPADNQIPLFDTITSLCKTFVGIIEGSHCNFASSSSICEQAENGDCGSITRSKQNQIVTELVVPYLNYYLKNNTAAFNQFYNKLNTLDSITYIMECDTALTVLNEYIDQKQIDVYPNPASNFLEIKSSYPLRNIEISDLTGRILFKTNFSHLSSQLNETINISNLSEGIYLLKVNTLSAIINKKIIIKK